MNRIPRDKQEQIIALLVEGCSIRSVERLTGVHRDTATRFLVRTGEHCARLLDEHLTGVEPRMVQCDEVWTYCRKKDRRLTTEEKHDPTIGSQFVFVSFDPETKLAINHLVGKRTPENTNEFMLALRARIAGRPKLVTGGFDPYVSAIFQAFGRHVDYAQLIKTFVGDGHPVAEGYSPAQEVLRYDPLLHHGYMDPWEISTSLVERQNATARNFMKRLTRLTYGFSKKLDNLRAAVDLHFCWYNFGRRHRTLRMTPAMAAGVATRFWEISDLLPAW